MRLSFQVALALLIGLGALYPGVMSFLFPEKIFLTFFETDIFELDRDLRLAIETQVRLLAGMWVAAGAFLLWSVREFEKHTLVIRLVLTGMILSAFGELQAVGGVTGSIEEELLPSMATILICVFMECWRAWLTRKKTDSVPGS